MTDPDTPLPPRGFFRRTRPTAAPSNLQRAVWAEAALDIFTDAADADSDEALTDLLTNLMHWASYSGSSFATALKRARYHFDLEGGL